jgi:hypothetical protein
LSRSRIFWLLPRFIVNSPRREREHRHSLGSVHCREVVEEVIERISRREMVE